MPSLSDLIIQVESAQEAGGLLSAFLVDELLQASFYFTAFLAIASIAILLILVAMMCALLLRYGFLKKIRN